MGLLPGKVTRSWYARCITALNDKWFDSFKRACHTFPIQKARCRRSILDVETTLLSARNLSVKSHVVISHYIISPQSVAFWFSISLHLSPIDDSRKN